MSPAPHLHARSRTMLLGALTAMTASTLGCEPDPGAPAKRWSLVFTDQPSAFLSVWGSSGSDVFVVGSDVGDGPAVLRWNGAAWRTLPTDETGDLWWVSGTTASGRVWMVGEGGLALRYDRATDSFERVGGVPDDVTLYGVFETGGDVWAVGGDRGDSTGHIYALAGATFVEDDTVPADAKAAGQFSKVWGRASTDLWVVGRGDKMLHRDGNGWRVVDTPGGRSLFSVHGNDATTVAVGSLARASVIEASGGVVSDVTPPDTKQLNGVWVEPDGIVTAVGVQGTVIERRGSVWKAPANLPDYRDDYQAVYVDPAGGVWAVGGALVVEPPREGVLLHYGDAIDNQL